MNSLIHLPLERYKQRYTDYLCDWEKEAFSKHFKVQQLKSTENAGLVLDINSGSVLDSNARPLCTMNQIAQLLKSPARNLGRIYFSDFFSPGLESLPYSGKEFQASAFCWAQTFDKFDFTVKFIDWLRPWEVMAFSIYRHVFVACYELAELICTAIPGLEDKVVVVGLPFNSQHVLNTWEKNASPSEEYDCVYTSRWDSEKNPNIFLSLIEANPSLKYAICTGSASIQGSDQSAIYRLNRMLESGKFDIQVFTGLTKGKYYAILFKCKVQFNCALQDWVSFTLLEALTMGCKPLYPNFRSFPSTLAYSEKNLYAPMDVEDASAKLKNLLSTSKSMWDKGQEVLDYHNQTLERIAKVIAR